MKRLLPVLAILLTLSYGASAQVVQWASKVLDFSSEITHAQYSAQQALGKPNVMPAGGDNPNAWMPDKPNRKEFLKLGFDKPMSIKQIAIAESFNPSALYRILVYDETGKEYELSTFNPMSIPMKGRMMNFFLEPTPYKVAAVKLEFDGAAVPDYYAIDAVAISDSNYPIVAFIPTPELLASGIVTEVLDKNVNSDVNELNPILSPDGKTLYFSRSNHPDNSGGKKDKEDIWYSELGADGKWQLAKNAGAPLNNEYPNFVSSISSTTPDGKSVIMLLGNKYDENGDSKLAGVSMSSNVGGNWTKPVALKIEDDYNFHEKANYFLANNRKTLLMSVQREDTRGDRDLYVSFMRADSSWSRPLNLGAVVNTAGEESAPFLALDDKTLYFSSNGFSGYGGTDIYVSKRLDDTWTNWSEPENLGPDINSPKEDLFFNIPANSEYAYYSRGVSDNNTDIFRIKLPIMRSPEVWVTVRGKLVDGKTGEPIGAKIVYERLPDGTDVGITQSDPKTGEYEIKLPAGHLYGIRAEADGHISESQNIDLRNAKGDTIITGQDFRLQPINVTPIDSGVHVTLNNIFFDFDQVTLRAESYSELDRIVKMLNDRASMTIEIDGHADATGPEQYNLDLSKRRAAAVQKYLTGKGVDVSRVTIAFFGESKPVVPNTTKENRRKNRRVEFVIVKP
ncbi:MAG: OmpA family protein [Cyclobacteriaceae bacterium]|nr:MAG: OmpA family protein [Cyclobacteriaceae bacterium]